MCARDVYRLSIGWSMYSNEHRILKCDTFASCYSVPEENILLAGHILPGDWDAPFQPVSLVVEVRTMVIWVMHFTKRTPSTMRNTQPKRTLSKVPHSSAPAGHGGVRVLGPEHPLLQHGRAASLQHIRPCPRRVVRCRVTHGPGVCGRRP